MEKTDVLIIGGSAAGIVTALTGKSNYPEKEFLVIRKEEKVMVPCGIPYIFGSLGSSDKNIVPDAVLTNKGIKIEVDEVISIDQNKKVCITAKGKEINFEKLILATGSIPTIPGWLKGTNLENVFTISKDKIKLDKVFQKIKDCKKIVVIGAGFIGVEMSDELNKLGKEVTLIEILPHVLGLILDEEIAVKAEEALKTRGVKIKTGVGVKEIIGNGKVKEVLLENKEKIEADAVILAINSVNPATPKAVSPIAVEKIAIVPSKIFTERSLYKFVPAILASAQAVDANITALGFLVMKSFFSAQSPTANISEFSVLIYPSTLIYFPSLTLSPDF